MSPVHDKLLPECKVRWEEFDTFRHDQKEDNREIWKRLNRIEVRVAGYAAIGSLLAQLLSKHFL
jgi:hypothetical protein